MAEISKFFADVGGDRLTTAAELNRIFDQLMQEKDGVIRGLGNTLAVTNAGTVSVDVNTGSAIMGGRLYENTASKNLALDAVTSGSKRYDRIVVRVDETARTMLLTVIKGVEGASPAVPAIDGTTDVLLAKILLDRSSGSYVYTLTDERVYCDGLVSKAIIAKLNAGTYSEDDIVDGTSYARVQKAKADAINGGTYDAASVSAFGIGSSAKKLGAGIDFDDLITDGLFFLTTGVVNPPHAIDYWFVLVISENYTSQKACVQLAWEAGASGGKMYMRESYYDAPDYVWTPWRKIWSSGSDGNGGQQPAPKPATSAIIGQWGVLATDTAGDVYLPSGGTWAYFTCYIAGGGAAVASVAAGGTKVRAYGSNLGNVGFAWRIA